MEWSDNNLYYANHVVDCCIESVWVVVEVVEGVSLREVEDAVGFGAHGLQGEEGVYFFRHVYNRDDIRSERNERDKGYEGMTLSCGVGYTLYARQDALSFTHAVGDIVGIIHR